MFDEEGFNEFIKEMKKGIDENRKHYNDTWKKEDIKILEFRLKSKYKEYELTNKPSKLSSLANLAMMLYVRSKDEE